MPTLEQRARHFARDAHGKLDQRRKYTQEPYIIHLAAAWLHDTVEDTGVDTAAFWRRRG